MLKGQHSYEIQRSGREKFSLPVHNLAREFLHHLCQRIRKDTESRRQQKNLIVRDILDTKILSEPSYQVSWLWLKQQDRILEYSPKCDKARLWNLEDILRKGYYKFGIQKHMNFGPKK
jgi:hypothetical protein